MQPSTRRTLTLLVVSMLAGCSTKAPVKAKELAPPPDPVRAEMVNLRDSLKRDLASVKAALRTTDLSGGPADRQVAVARAADMSRRVAQGFRSYPAKTPEVKELAQQAATAWGDQADALARMNAKLDSLTGDGGPGTPEDLKKHSEAVQAARVKVDEAMRKLARLADQHGL